MLKSIKTIQSCSPVNGEFENLGFVPVTPVVCMICAFVYNAVNVNKIVVISSMKLPSYPYS